MTSWSWRQPTLQDEDRFRSRRRKRRSSIQLRDQGVLVGSRISRVCTLVLIYTEIIYMCISYTVCTSYTVALANGTPLETTLAAANRHDDVSENPSVETCCSREHQRAGDSRYTLYFCTSFHQLLYVCIPKAIDSQERLRFVDIFVNCIPI